MALFHLSIYLSHKEGLKARPGAVCGNAPGDSRALGLRRWRRIAGAGLRDSLPAGPL